MLPTYLKTHNLILAWEAGLAWAFVIGAIVLIGAFLGPAVRTCHTGRAAGHFHRFHFHALGRPKHPGRLARRIILASCRPFQYRATTRYRGAARYLQFHARHE
jgi:hypothetical protein